MESLLDMRTLYLIQCLFSQIKIFCDKAPSLKMPTSGMDVYDQ